MLVARKDVWWNLQVWREEVVTEEQLLEEAQLVLQ